MNTNSKLNLFLYSLLSVAIIWQFSEIIRGWDNVILAHQGWRQSQTAIAAYYFLKDGFSIYTTIPVFGPPWILPLEFPLYQWILAIVVTITDLPIDQSGRGISLFFHYASLFAIWKILKLIGSSRTGILLTLTLLTISPLATYWAQGVLIESFSVFLSLIFIYYCLKSFQDNKPIDLTIACVVGGIASVVKITTFSVSWGFVVLFAIDQLYKNRSSIRENLKLKNGYYLLPLTLPLVCAGIWILNANRVISELPISIDSLSSTEWYFGELKSRFDLVQIKQTFLHTFTRTLGYSVPILFCAIALLGKKTKKVHIIIFLLTTLSGPLVFWNVYYVHDYYSYEIVFFLCAAIGLSISELIPYLQTYSKPLPFVLITFLVGTIIYEYYDTSYAWLLRNDYMSDVKDFSQEITKLVPENEFILIAGHVWDPSIPYSSERRSIMIRFNSMIESQDFWDKFDQIIKDGYKCGGVVIRKESLTQKQIDILHTRFDISKPPDADLGDDFLFYRI